MTFKKSLFLSALAVLLTPNAATHAAKRDLIAQRDVAPGSKAKSPSEEKTLPAVMRRILANPATI